MFLISECVRNALVVYILAVLLMYLYKPKLMFTESGERKKYGLGPGKTLFSFEVCCLLLAVLVFFITVSITDTLSRVKITIEE